MSLDVAKTLGKLLADARRDEEAARVAARRATERVLFLEAAHRIVIEDHEIGSER